MPSFELRRSEVNAAVVDWLKKQAEIKVEDHKGSIRIYFSEMLSIPRVELHVSDDAWARLLSELRMTLNGGHLKVYRDEILTIHPVRNRCLQVRLDLLDDDLIRRAAGYARKTLSDFVREAALSEAKRVLEKR